MKLMLKMTDLFSSSSSLFDFPILFAFSSLLLFSISPGWVILLGLSRRMAARHEMIERGCWRFFGERWWGDRVGGERGEGRGSRPDPSEILVSPIQHCSGVGSGGGDEVGLNADGGLAKCVAWIDNWDICTFHIFPLMLVRSLTLYVCVITCVCLSVVRWNLSCSSEQEVPVCTLCFFKMLSRAEPELAKKIGKRKREKAELSPNWPFSQLLRI